MTLSYHWLHQYLPVTIEPERLSVLLTSLGLEVESMHRYESIPGGLQGLVVGEVLDAVKHPNADKLRLTHVDIGKGEPLQIVCGAPNVAQGQKVIVAPVGTTIHPLKGEPLTMEARKIRGIESQGMICAEDEVGLGESHEGIVVLPAELMPGTPVADYYHVVTDYIYELGITPNRMDAMSHLGIARDLCAWLSIQEKKSIAVKTPFQQQFEPATNKTPVDVVLENAVDCQRYSGVTITGVQVGPSPAWLADRLRAIGLRPINNIVDITNFILHETGQPLHAFDLDAITGHKVIVKNVADGTAFVTLDGKERKLSAEDLMICDGEGVPMCIGGVFGGLTSGVKDDTKRIFLESAWFNPVAIRKTSFAHQLRTDAATRFEKGVDISNTVIVLKRAALLIAEVTGGTIASGIVDVYPAPWKKKEIVLKYHYLKKLSGKNYHPDTVRKILTALGFDILNDGIDQLWVAAPFSKPDVELPADVVEEIMRIDGFDQIAIPSSINITPSVDRAPQAAVLKTRAAEQLAGQGFFEIFTNSITNAAYFDEQTLQRTVRMLNSLSAGLNVMRPSMLQTGLQSIAHNLNRKNEALRFFEFGKIYWTEEQGKYGESERLCLYLTGLNNRKQWKQDERPSDFFLLKGYVSSLLRICGISDTSTQAVENGFLQWQYNGQVLARAETVREETLRQFDIRQPVYFAELYWEQLMQVASGIRFDYREIPRFPAVQRDLAIVVDKHLPFAAVERAAIDAGLERLRSVQLFDLFESEKLGISKKSLALSFTFQDLDKTLTDAEIDQMMQQLMQRLQTDLAAEIRK